MPIYHRLGELPRKRHTALRKPGGPDAGVYSEHLMGNLGFTGPSSLLYHLHPPTAVRAVEPMDDPRGPLAAETGDGAVRHRHLRTSALPAGGSPTLERVPLLFNGDVAVAAARPDVSDEHFYRNGAADEYVFVAEGAGVLESELGDLPFSAGRPADHPPRRAGPLASSPDAGPARMLVLESAGLSALATALPQRARPAAGGRAVFRAGHPPAGCAADPRRARRLRGAGAHTSGLQRMVLDHHPLRRRGLGRLLLPLGVQHPRLRADHRHDPPAAADPPAAPGRRLRGLQLLPAALRLPPRGGAGALQPQQRDDRRGALLRLEPSS